MKIKAKIKKPNIINIRYEDKNIKLDLSRSKFVDGYMPVISAQENSDGMLDVITTIINKNRDIVVPIRTQTVTKEDFNNYNFDNDVLVFENKKAIYKVGKEEYYVIDLENTDFINKDNKQIPSNPIFEMNDYKLINKNKIIAHTSYYSFIYDVCNNVKKSMFYDFIEANKKYKNMYSAYYFSDENKYSNLLIIHMLINDHGGICNEALLNEGVLAFIPNSIIGNKEKTIRYCDDCYNTYIETNNKKGKIIN